MSGTRLDSDHERVQAVWLAAKKLAQHPSIEVLVSRIALFSQPEPQRASLIERLLSREQRLFGLVTTALDALIPGGEPFHAKTETLGDAKTTGIVLAICYHELARTLAPISGINHSAFFKQSVAVAAASETFAERSCRFAPLEAYGAGLLHHLGILLIGVAQNQRYPQLLNSLRESHGRLVTDEKKALGYSHDEVADVICEAWGLPGHILDGIRNHEEDAAGQKTIGLCVSLAARFCNPIGYDGGLGEKSEELPVSNLRCVGVGEHNVQRIVELIHNEVRTFEQISSEMIQQAA